MHKVEVSTAKLTMAKSENKRPCEDIDMLPKGDDFHEIRRKRKIRERSVDKCDLMDTDEREAKRPTLPPISADKISVSSQHV